MAQGLYSWSFEQDIEDGAEIFFSLKNILKHTTTIKILTYTFIVRVDIHTDINDLAAEGSHTMHALYRHLKLKKSRMGLYSLGWASKTNKPVTWSSVQNSGPTCGR